MQLAQDRVQWRVLIPAVLNLRVLLPGLKATPWPESASELHRPSDLRLSTKSMPTFADRGVSRSQLGGCPAAVFSVF
jgi:hypothetical protein